ncbi:tyrosine recombinase XerD [Lachnospiraceae bacterium]|nr:tyrosine recombinase XerD [Lachnospiraceae bacterium]
MPHNKFSRFQTEQEVGQEVERFQKFLEREDLMENTILGYTWTIRYFLCTYHTVNEDTLLKYKSYLVSGFSPATANQRIQAVNKYLRFIDFKYHVKAVKVQQKPFLENVISMQDYKFLKRKLKMDNPTYYFLIWGMACTGARISEILCIKAEHIVDGQMDFYGKGKKYRRIYFIKDYQNECLKWLESMDKSSGYIFLKGDGGRLTIKGVEKQLKSFARIYTIDKAVMYPHSFRHLFGKTFYENYHDLPLLADLMGHASLDTTRIYSRRTSAEQASIINKIVTW